MTTDHDGQSVQPTPEQTPAARPDSTCPTCGLDSLDTPDADACPACRAAARVWTHPSPASETSRQVTRVSITHPTDSTPQSVIIAQHAETHAEPDRVGLPGGRVDTLRDLHAEGVDRATFADHYSTTLRAVDGTTTVDFTHNSDNDDDQIILTQQPTPETTADEVTLTPDMLAGIHAELTTGGDDQ